MGLFLKSAVKHGLGERREARKIDYKGECMDRKRNEDTEFNFSTLLYFPFLLRDFLERYLKKSMLISGPEFLLYIWGFHQFPGREGKCNILFCKYVYHSLREFVKMWSLDIWKNGDGFKNIAMDRFHWKECYSREPNVNYSVLLQSTRRPNRILVLMCFCSLSSATFSSEVQFQ